MQTVSATTPFDSTQALKEGWLISRTCGLSDPDETYRLERHDEANIFTDDAAAWANVATHALNGSEYHKEALRFIAQHNPKEFERIENHVAFIGVAHQPDLT